MNKSLLCFVAILAGLTSPIHAQVPATTPDSLRSVKPEKVESLHEVVVEAATRKDIKQGIAFFPTKREKEFATDATNLIQLMALTELPYDYRKNAVTDAAGASVNYFIDGREATQKELKAMNPRDVVRVEYFPMPTSGKFHGKRNVVNYVMKKYETGGFTRISALQYLDGRHGDYSLSSRFAHKEMIFDAFFEGDYVNRVNTGSMTDNAFKGITYDGVYYDELHQTVDNTRNRSKKNDLSAFFKAIWSHRALSLIAMAGWNRVQQPDATNISNTTYTPQAIESAYAETGGSMLNINPYARINMSVDLPRSQSLSLMLSGSYQAEKASSLYIPQNLSPIFNATKDRSWSGMAQLSWSKQLNDKNSLDISALITRKSNNTDYEGSFDGKNEYRDLTTQLSATFSHIFRKGTYLSVAAGAERNEQKINGVRNEVQWNPTGNINFSHKWNSKSSFQLSSNIFTMGYGGDAMNDVIIRTSELLWRKGNPLLKDRLWWQSSMTNTWNFNPKFSMTLRGLYTRVFHQDADVWEVLPGYDGLVASIRSDNNANILTGGARATLKLFKKKLVLNGDVEYTFFHLSGLDHRSKGYVAGSVSATWYGKGWYIAGIFVPAATSSYMYGIAEIYNNRRYTFNIGFNKVKNLNLRLQIANPFGEKWTSITRINTEHFSRRTQAYSCFAANRFSLTAIYTISYGKKVSKVNMSKQGQIDSGAMKAE